MRPVCKANVVDLRPVLCLEALVQLGASKPAWGQSSMAGCAKGGPIGEWSTSAQQLAAIRTGP